MIAGLPTSRVLWFAVLILAVFAVAGFSMIQVQYNDTSSVAMVRGLGQEFMAHGFDPASAIVDCRPSYSLLFLWIMLLMGIVLVSTLRKNPTLLVVASSVLGLTWIYLYITFSGVFNRTEFFQSSIPFWLSTVALITLSIWRARRRDPATGASM